MKKLLALFSLLAVFTLAAAEPQVANLRGPLDLTEEEEAPRMAREVNDDIRTDRDYPMAAPTIPHKIDGYQIDLKANKCLSCHNRQRVEESQAVMVSVTHFMNRDGNFLADVSPNRYFCTQCHASQLDVDPLIDNDFVSMDELFDRAAESH
ncbi:nitrate reductase cytochrome c-type subunit [Reinekea blandensis]|uniref:Periplasmic nitrate reductase, electron transfer subunit n=1 Tax=Reinekea blandensis MED297 TaxID=314283 RepID=A4BGR0_9GAMM|nr:nitrate reductase cytochrome c-type subunit [Reinekea blandensis]EAR08708.1 Nitrate reductase cytochrome c-type subunit [Reinekea sp. MED297] [Reinekea blandensis MED297]